jgi:hypothetical protein
MEGHKQWIGCPNVRSPDGAYIAVLAVCAVKQQAQSLRHSNSAACEFENGYVF